MIPAHFSYAAWMMKSAESSAGLAPATFATQLGALSMIADIDPLPRVAPALLAHGPLDAREDQGEQQDVGDEQAQHRSPPQRREVLAGAVHLAPVDDLSFNQRPVGLDDLLQHHPVLGMD